MPEEQKTLAINTSKIVEAQQAQAKNKGDFPKTVAIDSKELVERLERIRHDDPKPSRRSAAAPYRKWIVVAAVVSIAIVLYSIVAG